MPHQTLITVKGKVQGVAFRAYTRDKAEQLNLKGWVKNNPDGTVSILVQGEKDDVEKFLIWCKEGPQPARVDDIKITTPDIVESLNEFEIRY